MHRVARASIAGVILIVLTACDVKIATPTSSNRSTPVSEITFPESHELTSANTILQDGETWYAEGWSLTVSNFTYRTLHDVKITLRNRTGRTVVLPDVNSKVLVVSDQDDKEECRYGFRQSQIEMKPDTEIEVSNSCGSVRDYSSKATKLTLTVDNVADIITNARWETPIPRP